MSQSNIAAFRALFAPPASVAGVPTTADLQKQQWLGLVEAMLALNYAQIQLPLVQQEQQQIDAQININPATASDALRLMQQTLQAEAESLEEVIDTEYLDYTNGVNAWYTNMTSGSAYVPMDQWPATLPASYPNLFAAAAKVTFQIP